MTTPLIIGLTGLAGSGKDTVRALLEEQGFYGLAFADPIRDMIRMLLTSGGISEVYIDERGFKEVTIPELGVSYRHLAQTLGTEWGRGVCGDLWIRLAGAHMADMQAQAEVPPHNFALSDVRFENEAQWVRDRGGVIWRVHRPDVAAVREHVSESEMGQIAFSQMIWNKGSLRELRANVYRALTVEIAKRRAK